MIIDGYYFQITAGHLLHVPSSYLKIISINYYRLLPIINMHK